MKRALAIVGILAVIFVALWTGVAFLVLQADQERLTQEQLIVALGAQLAPSLQEMSTFGEPLKEACKGKLEPGGPRSVVLYSLPLEPSVRPSLEGRRVDGVLASWSNTYVGLASADPLEPTRSLGQVMARLDEFYEWPRRLEQRADLRAETQALRYVTVALLSDLSPASIPFLRNDGTFDAGRAEYRAKVVSFPDGKVVCEGVGKGRMIEKVVGHGKGRDSFDAKQAARSELERKLVERWVEATLGSPLEDVCQAGGERLCSSSALMTAGPDW